MEDHSQAISFANSYFSLVDGLAPGLEDHLAQNVVLDWFGRTIRGRANVTAFMKAHKVGSRHVFNCIAPVPDINYRKSHVTRKISTRSTTDNYAASNTFKSKQLNLEKLSINEHPEVIIDPENNNIPDKIHLDTNEILDSEGNQTNEDCSIGYELDEDDLANLFSLEITLTHPEEIEKNINQIKSEELSSAGKIFRREYELEDGPEIVESTQTVKYVRADGQIEFSKKSIKRGTDLQTWRRQCQLQIAYSVITSEIYRGRGQRNEEFCQSMETDDTPSSLEEYQTPRRRLPSLGEITEMSNNLVPNINCNFGGYFPTNIDFEKERDHFLENFNAELIIKNASASKRTPQYVDNRLVFGEVKNKPKVSMKMINNEYEGNGFVFNYLIHLIIYQGSSRCRRSLSQDFDASVKKEL